MTPEQFLAFARVLPEPLLLVAGDGRILAANPPCTELLALRSDAIHEHHLAELVVTPLAQLADYLGACARSRALVLGSLTFQASDGRLIITRSEGGVVRPWSRAAPALILMRLQLREVASQQFLLLNKKIDVLSREIRARRRAELELSRQREHLRVTLASIGDAVIVTDAQGLISFVNPIAAELTGWAQDAALAQPLDSVFRLVNLATSDHGEHPVGRALREQIIVELANHSMLVAQDGTARPIDASAAPIQGEDDRVIGVVLVFRDVTERRRAELRQRFLAEASVVVARSLDRATTLEHIAGSAIPVFAELCFVDLVQSDGYIERVAVAGGTPDMQARLAQALPQDDHRNSYGPGAVIRSGQVERISAVAEALGGCQAADLPYLRLLAEVGVSSTLCVPLATRSGISGAITWATTQPNGRYSLEDVAVATEVVHRCAMALDNAHLYEQAQEAIRLRDVFLSVASHELKTPLTSLLGNAQLLQRRMAQIEEFAPSSQRAMAVIAEQASRLNRMIVTLLDISRLERGQLGLELCLLDLSTLVQQVVAEIQPTLERHTVVYEAPAGGLLVTGDMLRLEQVFQNVVANALKYSPAGGPVVVRGGEDADQVWVSVTDHGIGIPAQDIARLSERFYRASNVDARHISGLGIGLFVVKEIVALHGGALTVASVEGVGSTFTIRLPGYRRHRSVVEAGAQ